MFEIDFFKFHKSCWWFWKYWSKSNLPGLGRTAITLSIKGFLSSTLQFITRLGKSFSALLSWNSINKHLERLINLPFNHLPAYKPQNLPWFPENLPAKSPSDKLAQHLRETGQFTKFLLRGASIAISNCPDSTDAKNLFSRFSLFHSKTVFFCINKTKFLNLNCYDLFILSTSWILFILFFSFLLLILFIFFGVFIFSFFFFWNSLLFYRIFFSFFFSYFLRKMLFKNFNKNHSGF